MTYTGYFKRLDLVRLDYSYNSVRIDNNQKYELTTEHVESGEPGMESG